MSDRDPYPSEKQERFIVRLPDGMRDRIRAAAEANNRSMNAEIVSVLEERFPAPERAFDFDKWKAHTDFVAKRSREIIAEMNEIVGLIRASKTKAEVDALNERFNALQVEHEAIHRFDVEDDRFHTEL
tara:strand:+ start:15517 stop:15900 length:384 start_codon:yes stop_codon:yes gene_type:complete